MAKLHMDWLATIWVASVLSVLWLPDFMLLPWQQGSMIVLLLLICASLFRINKNSRISLILVKLSMVILCIGYAHYQPLKLLKLADNVANLPHKLKTEFSIEEIIHQQRYQTLIIKAQLHPDLPEQRIYTHWNNPEPVKLGERWRAELQLRSLTSRLNQGGFDRQPWYFAKGISAWASVKSAVRISADFSWRQQRMHAALQQTEDLERQGLLLALGFGERAWLKTEHWQMYQQTNTVHLLAISGLHIGLAMACGFMLIRGVQFFMPTIRITPWLPVLGGFCLAYGYAELAGFSIPTFRAITALAILSALRLCRVYCTAWQLFIRVIALLLLCEPLMVLSASFWLSIGAVACLIIWYQVFPLSLLEWRGKPFPAKVRWILALFHLQLGLLWLFMPVQLAVFNGFSAYGFWANLITVPLFSFILVPIVLFAVLTQGALSSWQIADFLAAKIEWVLSWLQGGWVNVSEKTALMLTAILLTAFLGLMKWIYRHRSKVQGQWKKRNKGFALKSERNLPLHWQRRVMYVGSVGMVFCILIFMLPHINRPNWRLETLDVGQGLAILIIKNEQALLYDTGAGWQGGSMAKIEVIPYLRRQGIQLDHLILSHDDNDHVGGATEIMTQYPALKLMTPSRQNYLTTDRTFCVNGLKQQWQGLRLTVLSPQRTVERAGNKDSCVLLIEDGQYRVLLTGDADIRTENRFAQGLGKIDVLQAGHHGSKTSTGHELVTQIRPTISLISSGRWNRWRFPHQEVIQRLREAQSEIYNTAVSGQISLLFRDDRIEVHTARSDFSPWYRRQIATVE